MPLLPLWPEIHNQVDGPLTPRPRWQWHQLPLPAPMRLPCAQLALKAPPHELAAVLLHPRPVVLLLQHVEKLLTSNVVIGEMGFFHEQGAQPT